MTTPLHSAATSPCPVPPTTAGQLSSSSSSSVGQISPFERVIPMEMLQMALCLLQGNDLIGASVVCRRWNKAVLGLLTLEFGGVVNKIKTVAHLLYPKDVVFQNVVSGVFLPMNSLSSYSAAMKAMPIVLWDVAGRFQTACPQQFPSLIQVDPTEIARKGKFLRLWNCYVRKLSGFAPPLFLGGLPLSLYAAGDKQMARELVKGKTILHADSDKCSEYFLRKMLVLGLDKSMNTFSKAMEEVFASAASQTKSVCVSVAKDASSSSSSGVVEKASVGTPSPNGTVFLSMQDLLESLGGIEIEAAKSCIIPLARGDVNGAIAAAKTSAYSVDHSLLFIVEHLIASGDFQQARAVAMAMEAGTVKSWALCSVCRVLQCSGDGQEAVILSQEIVDEEERSQVLLHMSFVALDCQDSKTALSAAKNIPVAKVRNMALEEIQKRIPSALPEVGKQFK